MKYKKLQVPDFDNINVRELNTSEFAILVHHAKNKELSPFAKFCQALNGFDLYFNREKISKWEGFYICADAEIILMDNAKIKAIERESNRTG